MSILGTGYSCNEVCCSFISKLQSSAEKRRYNRDSSSCNPGRPKCLRIRRRIHKGKCNCKPTCTQKTAVEYAQSKDDQVRKTQAKQSQVHVCGSHGEPPKCCSQGQAINKNICRFTVDAYFN
ncbi:unnamed protein product [Parnassius mnemosyne]|uniref:Uncharacterized protein n=1 Tax=Parnassius mnemosyne TaxID=213953 RepID=A0AAV1L2E7_9NEOP